MLKFILCLIFFTTSILPACSNRQSSSVVQAVPEDKSNIIIEVPNINQYPTLPTGCESTAAVMVLRFYKEEITITDFAEYCLPKNNAFYYRSGALYGPNPREYFVGDPFSEKGYGCFAPVIVKAVNSNSRLCRAQEVSGSLPELCQKYIDNGKPLLIWATMNMKPTKDGNTWTLSNGDRFVWPAGEHCLVLVGYDESNYYFNDPLKGETVGYEREVVESRYQALGSQAVLIEACVN